jgi:PIN domain
MLKVRRPPPQHLVIVDTNVLWDKDKKLSVSPIFDEFWAKNSPLLPMTLHVPQVVLGELHFQQTTSALKTFGSLSDASKELSGITDSPPYRHKYNEATIRNQVRAKLEKWLKTAGGSELATPVNSIDWAAVVESAVWRKPPFTLDPKDQKNEKGFRDAVILETVAHTCENLAPGKLAIFVCNDYLLRTTAEERLKASKKFLAFESLADFEAYIQLTQQQFTNDFVKSIQSHARAKFFSTKANKADQTSIFLKNDIIGRIRAEFSADLEFTDLTKNTLSLIAQAIGTTAPAVKPTKEKFWIRSTQFAKLEGKREFHWTSRVEVAQLFEMEKSGGLPESAPIIRKIQVVGFDVKWKANVKTDGRFHDIDVTALEKAESQLLEATEEAVERLKL